MPAFDFLIFDFDGTLADSRDLLAGIVNRVLAECGLPQHPAERIGRLIGLPLRQVLATVSGAPDAVVDDLFARYRRYADDPEIIARFTLFPGARDTLETLASHGVTLGIATSKLRSITMHILAHCQLDRLIAHVGGGDDVRRGKPDPEAVHRLLGVAGVPAARTALVGDTTYDIEMGNAAGVTTIAATYGMHDRDTLAAVRPTHFIDDICDLLRLVCREENGAANERK